MERKRERLDIFSGHPSFPNDVPTALLRLSLKDLLAEDETGIQRLGTACEEIARPRILEGAHMLFEIGASLFELPLEEKQKYDFSSQRSSQDAAFYNVSRDHIMGMAQPLLAPNILKKNHYVPNSFLKCSYSIVTLILDLLNAKLGLPESTLANIHRLQAVSGDQVRFVKAPPQPADDRRTALGEYTDFGKVSVLFNRLGGLQVLPPGLDAEWQYVRPLPGHAIVNLGDAMVKLTNGLFRSNIHRVVSPPGEQADSTRYSLTYFSRPEDDVPLRRLGGSSRIPELGECEEEEAINSKDWTIPGTEILSRRLGA
ncbi:hypothetical protein BJX76DRAFT_365460 [Aspergillus varians]